MNKQEVWQRWEPINNLAKNDYIDAINYNLDGFIVILGQENNPKQTVHLVFKNGIRCHRETNESFICKAPFEHQRTMHSDDYWNWTFFKVTNSEYLKWLSKKSCGISDHMELMHISILGVESMLDIITTYEPTFEFVNLE